MQTILVTGVNGFVGKHLVRELNRRGHNIIGAGLDKELAPDINKLIKSYYICDLTDPIAIKKLPLGELTGVISLAGLAQVGSSFKEPDLYKKINVQVLSVLCTELLNQQYSPRVIAVSSGSVYAADQALPLTEKSKLIAEGSPYTLSKILMEEATEDFVKQGLDCIVVRPFNHIGPGQGPGFLVPDLYKKLRETANKTIKTGNLSTKRDYTDVRDVARAYCDLLEKPKLENRIFNVCSGRSMSGNEILQLLEEASAMNNIKIETDPGLIRPSDPKDIYGSREKLSEETGWQPTVPIEQTIKDFVNAAN